jgi:hypothetical protein
MQQYIVLGSVIIVTLALIADPSGTVRLVVAVITVKGITFVVKKIVDSFSRDSGDYINFAGNCLAGVSCVGLIKNAIVGVKPVTEVLGKVGSFVKGISGSLDRLSEFIEGLPFGLN